MNLDQSRRHGSTVEGALAAREMIDQREMHDPAMDRRMIDANTAFGQHFLQVTKAIPSLRPAQ